MHHCKQPTALWGHQGSKSPWQRAEIPGVPAHISQSGTRHSKHSSPTPPPTSGWITCGRRTQRQYRWSTWAPCWQGELGFNQHLPLVRERCTSPGHQLLCLYSGATDQDDRIGFHSFVQQRGTCDPLSVLDWVSWFSCVCWTTGHWSNCRSTIMWLKLNTIESYADQATYSSWLMNLTLVIWDSWTMSGLIPIFILQIDKLSTT